MRVIYDILFLICFVASLPYYFYRMWRRGNWKAGFRQRFGEYDGSVKQSITNRQVFWMHAVSVGEMNVCMQVIRALEPRLPNLKIIVSTTTTTAMGELQKRLPPHIGKVYYPIDRRKFVSRAIGTLHPLAIALVESEIWPNFIWTAKEQKIPLLLLNARLSERSYPRYRRLGFLFRSLFGSFDAVGAQNEEDAAKLRELGCRPDAVRTLRNLKFDAATLAGMKPLDVASLLRQVGVVDQSLVLVAGSTHDGEEEILAEVFKKLRPRFPNLFLVLVPRHFERARDAVAKVERLGLKLYLRSEISPETRCAPGSMDCLLVNTTGELMNFYQTAAVVFVGKSLTAKGGQNPIEPAALGKAVVFGPNMQNFSDVVRIFLAQESVVQVQDKAGLERALGELLADSERRAELGRRAERTARENQGGVAGTVAMIVEQLEKKGCYVAPAK